MKIKKNGNKIVSADIVVPTVEIGEFNDALTLQAKNELINSVNFGSRMLSVYIKHRDNMHVANILKMCEEMELIYADYSTVDYNQKRSHLAN